MKKKQTHKQTTNKNFQPLPVQLNQNCPLGMVVGACNPSTRKAEEAGLGECKDSLGYTAIACLKAIRISLGFRISPKRFESKI